MFIFTVVACVHSHPLPLTFFLRSQALIENSSSVLHICRSQIPLNCLKPLVSTLQIVESLSPSTVAVFEQGIGHIVLEDVLPGTLLFESSGVQICDRLLGTKKLPALCKFMSQ